MTTTTTLWRESAFGALSFVASTTTSLQVTVTSNVSGLVFTQAQRDVAVPDALRALLRAKGVVLAPQPELKAVAGTGPGAAVVYTTDVLKSKSARVIDVLAGAALSVPATGRDLLRVAVSELGAIDTEELERIAWDIYEPGERPDTIVFEKLPVAWFALPGEPDKADEKTIVDAFDKLYGRVTNIAIEDPVHAANDPFYKLDFKLFVQFRDKDSVKKAISSLNGKLVKLNEGKPVRLVLALDKSKRLADSTLRRIKDDKRREADRAKREEDRSKQNAIREQERAKRIAERDEKEASAAASKKRRSEASSSDSSDNSSSSGSESDSESGSSDSSSSDSDSEKSAQSRSPSPQQTPPPAKRARKDASPSEKAHRRAKRRRFRWRRKPKPRPQHQPHRRRPPCLQEDPSCTTRFSGSRGSVRGPPPALACDRLCDRSSSSLRRPRANRKMIKRQRMCILRHRKEIQQNL